VLRRLEDGTIVGTDSSGSVIEHNPMTGATRIARPDGSGQTTSRLEDGSYRVVLDDGTEIVTSPEGDQVTTAPDGTTSVRSVREDGWVNEGADGTTVTSTTGADGSTRVEYDYVTEAGGIRSVQRNPADGSMQVILGNGTELDITMAQDGSITVNGPDFSRTFDPGAGIAGRVQTALAADGSTTISSETGATSTISADGRTMTVESAGGSTAVATKDSTGVTVEVDGETYTYEFD